MNELQVSSVLGTGSTATTRTTSSSSSSGVTAKDSTDDSTTTSTSSDSTITANDFLTLLVTEMQNQDPTQPTDPNEYIQQMVGVNSLQQLISINEGISTIDSAI